MVESADVVTVRQAGPTDVEAIKRVFHSSVGGIDDAFYNPAQKLAWEAAIPDDSWPTRMLEFRFLVAELDGEIVGFASHSEHRLEDLYVASRASGKGVGSRLLSAVLLDYLDKEISLTASLNAEPIYLKFGFIEEERYTRTIGAVEVWCIRMRRPIV